MCSDRELTVEVIPAKVKPQALEEQVLKVAAYCRVSTKSEEQMRSLGFQKEYYYNLILSNKSWTLAGIYADNCSGIRRKNRIEYLRMLDDCEKRNIDLIITKSIGRFGRDALEVMKTTRRLREMGVNVLFELENLNTSDIKEQRVIEIFAACYQEECRQKSENVKFGIRESMRNGNVKLNYTNFLGYTKDKDGNLVIIPEEAETVRCIYGMYLSGNGTRKIKKYLEEHDIKTVTSKAEWSTSTIMRILTNEKYMGTLMLQKYYTPNFLDGKQKKNEGELKKYVIENNHEAIVDEDMWEEVQERVSG